MNNSVTKIDQFFDSNLLEDKDFQDNWDPGFDADRQLVYSKLGPIKKIFLRPEKFIKRFHHSLYPLPIEQWECTDRVKLYDNFCTISLTLDVRFQVTLKYAQRNMDILPDLYEHIKNTYHGQVIEIVNRELLNLSDGLWIQEGLESVEKRVCLAVSEMLILQNIQSQVVCQLKPSFEEFPDLQFAKEGVYLSVLKKSFEFSEQQKEELFRQQQNEERQKIEHKRKQFKHLNELAELDRQRQALYAENNKCLLEEKEKQQLEQFKIKKRIHADKLKHNNGLKEMLLISELSDKEKYQSIVRESEEREKTELIKHQASIQEKEIEARIATYDKQQESWRKARNKTYAQKLEQKYQQKQLEFEANAGHKRLYDEQRLADQEERYQVKKVESNYIKTEIELLELEKRRITLQQTIDNFQNKKGFKN